MFQVPLQVPNQKWNLRAKFGTSGTRGYLTEKSKKEGEITQLQVPNFLEPEGVWEGVREEKKSNLELEIYCAILRQLREILILPYII